MIGSTHLPPSQKYSSSHLQPVPGTGAYSVGDLLYVSQASPPLLGKIAAAALGQVFVAQGTNAAPAWSASLGLNAAPGATAGTYTATLGANNATGMLIKRFTDTSPTGAFVDFQEADGTSLLQVSAVAGNVIVNVPFTDNPVHSFKWRPGISGSGDFNIQTDASPNVFSARNDAAMGWGYNNSVTGGRENTGEPALTYRIESFYTPSSGVSWAETYIQWLGTTGSGHRPLFVAIDRDTNATATAFSADSLSFLDRAASDAQRFLFSGSHFYAMNGSFFSAYQNNYAFLRQLNAAGTGFVALLYLSSADRLVLGADGAVTGVTIGRSGGTVSIDGAITTGTWNATPIAGLYGGTGLTTAAVGDLLYASATTPTWARLAAVATGSVLVSAGVNTAPVWSASPSLATSLTVPLLIGGTGTTSALIYRTTTGVGTGGSDHIFQVGNNGATEALRIMSNGKIGVNLAAPDYRLDVADAKTNNVYTVALRDTTAMAAGVGGMLGFIGKYTSGGSYAGFGHIEMKKLNATDSNLSAYMSARQRPPPTPSSTIRRRPPTRSFVRPRRSATSAISRR
jgi:hypothetical protein